MQIENRSQLVKDHAEEMLRVLNLPKNALKGHWQGESIPSLQVHLEEEVEEFIAALWGFLHHGEPLQRVVDEGADCSNVISMIVDNCKRSAV